VKPLMGQAQSQLNLDDLFTSSKLVSGNFSRSRSDVSPAAESGVRKPSFSEVLLKNLDRKSETKNFTSERNSLGSKAEKTTNNSRELTTSQRVERRSTSLDRNLNKTHADKPSSAQYALKSQPKSARHEENTQVEINQKNPNIRAMETRDNKGFNQSKVDSINDHSIADKFDAALIPLHKQFGNKITTDSVVNNNAVLAFITGRLDKLQLETIPSLINESPLIQKALGSENIDDFLKVPVSINDLANLLELDQNLMAGAARDGLNPSDFVTPTEFIRALGIDPVRVETELNTLKQTLPTERVNTYIDRAETLATPDIHDIFMPQQSEITSKTAASLSEDLLASTTNSSDDQSLDENSVDSLSAVSPNYTTLQSNSNSLGNKFDRLNDHRAPHSEVIAGTTLSVATELSSPISTTGNQSAADDSESFSNPDAFDDLPLTKDQELPNNELLDAFRNGINPIKSGLRSEEMTANIPNKYPSHQTSNNTTRQDEVLIDKDFELKATDTDPFVEMSKELDDTTSTKIEFAGNGISGRSLEEILIDRNATAKIQGERLSSTDKSGSEPLELFNDSIESPKNNHIADQTFSNLEADQLLSKLSDRILDPATDLSGQSFDDGAGSNAFEGGSENPQPAFLSEKIGINRDAKVTFAQKVTTAANESSSNSLTQKIMGQAEMMFRNGGGSMRMDIETPEIGKVDVAINLNNNQLDVRIITPSDQARDIISREIAGLREGLSQQGLNLRGLEVGKAGESSSRDFAGQGNQHFGQGAQDQKATYNDMKEYVQSFRNSYAPRTNDRLSIGAPSMGQWSNQVARYGSKLEVRV
jgi:flagellar hook-length control protein FliK